MNYEGYDKILHNQFVWCIAFCIFGILMGILELVYINTKKRRGDREYYVLFVFAVIVIIVGIYLGKLAISYSHDAANHSYIVYEGDFLV